MKRKTILREIIFRFSTLICFLTVTILIVSVVTFKMINSIEEKKQLFVKTYLHFEKINGIKNRFLVEDIRHDELYQKGKTRKITTIVETLENLQKDLKVLSHEREFDYLVRSLKVYSEQFQKFSSNNIKLGHKDWGLEGEWRRSIHEFERSLIGQKKYIELRVEYLELRRREKDYLLRHDQKYEAAVYEIIEKITKMLPLRPAELSLHNRSLLEKYKEIFRAYVALQEEIDNSFKTLVEIEDELSLSLDLEIVKLNESEKKKKYEAVIAVTFILLFALLFSFIVVYLHAKKIAAPLVELTGIAKKIGEGDLSAVIESKLENEIGILANQINHMLQGLRLLNTQTKMATLGELSGSIAHDIRNPLAIIQWNVSMLKMHMDKTDVSKEEVYKTISKVLEVCDRIEKMLKGFVAVARNDQSDIPVPSPLKEIIDSSIEYIQLKSKMKSTTITVEPYNEEIYIQARPVQISQVLLNLMSNSCDAIEYLEKHWIKISIKEDGAVVKIFVRDSGSGIPADVKDKLFVSHYTSKEAGKGTGLGLLISQRIIKAHGGDLRIEDEENTCFVIELPLFK